MRRSWKMIARSGVLVVALLAVVIPASVASAAGKADVSDVRAATARFHDVAVAQEAGYQSLLSCFDSADGGMGQHYVRVHELDANVTASEPEALVYEVRDSGLQLVAVEYIVPQSAWSSSVPPTLLDQTFRRNDALGLWVLHAWIWRPNPAGMFENFNPAVPRCPGH